MKKLWVMVLAVLVLSGCGLADHAVSQEEIFAYVQENNHNLLGFPVDELPQEGRERREFVRETLGWRTVVLDVYRYNENILEFYCGGTGVGLYSTFEGFYYARDDQPFGLDFGEIALEPIGEDTYYWQSADGYCSILTQRIQPHWFYYCEEYQEPPAPEPTDEYGLPLQ